MARGSNTVTRLRWDYYYNFAANLDLGLLLVASCFIRSMLLALLGGLSALLLSFSRLSWMHGEEYSENLDR